MGAPVVHFEVTGRDGKRLQEFYRDLFDWSIRDANGYGLVDTEAGKGIAGGVGQTDQGDGHATFYVEVEDCQAALDRAEQLGGRTIVDVTTIPNMVTFGLFADPEGHVIGVVASEVPGAAG